MDVSIGDIVKVKKGVVLLDSKGDVFTGIDEEILIVLRLRGCDVRVESLKTGVEFWVSKIHLEFVQSSLSKKSLDKVDLNPAPKLNLNPAPKLNKQDVLSLVDIGLDTGDKEWFNELHSKLSALD